MADIVYTVNQDSPENIAGFEQYSQEDKALVSSFQINSVFDPTNNYSELHILSLSDELLESTYSYRGFSELGNAQSAGQAGVSVLTIDPIADSKAYGYGGGGVKLLYHFLDDLYSTDGTLQEFFIQDISQDRTELSLSTLNLTPEQLTATTSAIKTKLQSQSYFTGFRLNFKNNDLFIATNIDTLDIGTEKVVVVKLYEPLPTTYNLKSTLNIVDVVSDSVAYEIDAEYILPPEVAPTLRSPNFNIDVTDDSVVPTGYYNYNELFSYPVNNTNSQIFSTVNEKGIDISVDYTTFSDFVHFSSAQERLLNFKYKLDLITSYSASLSTIANSTTGLQGVSGSRDYYQNLLTGVVSNFDHYERFLYYESGSSSWPKSNTTKPYINKASTNSEAITWYANQIANAIKYDNTNYNSLAYSIPTFLRDDANNENYLTFVYMVGQHFDNLWLYSKAVTDKYDADNRIDKGISKDLVAEALKNFGVKLYTSNKSVEDLFTTFIGQAYQSGSEQINFYITGSLTGSNTPIQPTAYDDYQKEIQKRIYHNLPLLLKSKGTERGLRALINCFGIPADILKIKLYGGRNTNERPFYGDYQNYTSSLNKIRLDNTGSLVSGSTLSNYASIIKRDDKYTDDVHVIEVGFSPSDNIDNYIISRSLATASLSKFNIDNYLGDPSNAYLDNYSGLEGIATTVLSGSANLSMGMSGSYDLRDYVRLIKFFDNAVFKMVKDFIPARAVADTGIIIKPHLLNRSKAKSVLLSGSRPEYSGSIDTAFISARSANNFRSGPDEVSTYYLDAVQTPTGIGSRDYHYQGQVKYNGEISGSKLSISNINLNKANEYKGSTYSTHPYPVAFVSSSNEVCLLDTRPTPIYITSSQALWYPDQFFTFINSNCIYSASNNITTPTWTPIPTWPRTFGPTNGGYTQYRDFYIKATNNNVTVPTPGSCTKNIQVRFATCSISVGAGAPTNVSQYGVGGNTTQYDLATWFNNPNSQTVEYTASYSTSSAVDGIPLGTTTGQVGAYRFTQEDGTYVTITMRDPNIGDICKVSKTVCVGVCNLGARPYSSSAGTTDPSNTLESKHGFTFKYSQYTVVRNVTTTPSDATTSGVFNYNGTLANRKFGQVGYSLPAGRSPIGSTIGNRAVGLQAYFTPFTATGLTMNPKMRYNLFGLYANKPAQESSVRYNLLTIAQGINPQDAPQQWGVGISTLDDGNFYGPTNTFGDPALFGGSTSIGNTYFPICPFAPASNTLLATDAGTNTEGLFQYQAVPLPIDRSFQRAYVVQAYRVDQPTCIQTVVIYGDHEILGVAEGVASSNYPAYETRNLLADWNYIDNGTPQISFPNPVTGFGPWVTLKTRIYVTSEAARSVAPLSPNP